VTLDALKHCHSCGLLLYAVATEDSTDDPETWHWVCCECDGYDVGPGGVVVPR
jgi:hypothetical protein